MVFYATDWWSLQTLMFCLLPVTTSSGIASNPLLPVVAEPGRVGKTEARVPTKFWFVQPQASDKERCGAQHRLQEFLAGRNVATIRLKNALISLFAVVCCILFRQWV